MAGKIMNVKARGLLLFLIGSLLSNMVMGDTKTLLSQRQQYVQAEKARDRGQWRMLQALLPALRNYPLYPYLIYPSLTKRLPYASAEEIKAFIALDPASLLATNLRRQWLLQLARRGQWDPFLANYVADNNKPLQCDALWARWQRDKDPQVFKAVAPLWIEPTFHAKECLPLFDAWVSRGGLEQSHVWTRIRMAIKAENGPLVSYLQTFLPAHERPLLDVWFRVRGNPYVIQNTALFKGDHPFLEEVWVYGFTRLLQQSTDSAIVLWKKMENHIMLPPRLRGEVIRKIALKLVIRRPDVAEAWLKQVPDVAANPPVREWRILFALMHSDWQGALQAIHALPSALQELPDWQYWHARALEALNNHSTEATAIYQRVASNRNYYGFLASEHLEQAHTINHHPLDLSARDIDNIAAYPGIQRAREFYALGRVNTARREWNYAIRNMDEHELHAAARLAAVWSLPDRAILTSARAENQDDLEVRFPFAHKELVLREAQKHAIDPAWIFAVTRQESAFMDDATSSAGALGLMQLMPYTAKYLGRELRIPVDKRSLLTTPVNIRLGSLYLKKMLQANNNNVVLATAAYNAGPGRVNQWQTRMNKLSTDVWVETIPFEETREYLKRILTYTVIYAHRLGQTPTLPKQFAMDRNNRKLVKVAQRDQ
jgi:soluble lytic murein transglycosylase